MTNRRTDQQKDIETNLIALYYKIFQKDYVKKLPFRHKFILKEVQKLKIISNHFVFIKFLKADH